jgi:hypothetical protein
MKSASRLKRIYLFAIVFICYFLFLRHSGERGNTEEKKQLPKSCHRRKDSVKMYLKDICTSVRVVQNMSSGGRDVANAATKPRIHKGGGY